MPKYPDSFENFHRLHRNKQAKTLAGIIAGFVVFFGGLYYIMSASVPPSPEAEVVQPSTIPEEIPPPTEVAAAPMPEQTVVAPPAMAPVIEKAIKKTSKHKTSKKKKIAKTKSVKKDNLVCIPPSRLKALEKQVARASRR